MLLHLRVVLLSVVMLSIVLLNVVLLSVVMLRVTAPHSQPNLLLKIYEAFRMTLIKITAMINVCHNVFEL